MSREEIERQQMGDLTEPLKRERGEHIRRHGNYAPRGIPPDILAENTMLRTPIPPLQRSTKIGIGTEPVYSTLPANAVNCTFTQEYLTEDSVVNNQVIFKQTVPAGRIIYVREVRVNIIQAYSPPTLMAPPPGSTAIGIPQGLFQITLASNGNSDIFNQRVNVEPLDSYYPMYQISGPGDVITVSVSYDYSAVPAPIGFIDFLTTVRGDVLLPNEMPVPYTALLKGE